MKKIDNIQSEKIKKKNTINTNSIMFNQVLIYNNYFARCAII